MGQYYNAVVKIDEKKEVYYHYIDGQYMLAKLMEHSYWNNPFVLAVASKFWRKKGKLAWVGDYAEAGDFNWNDEFSDAHKEDVPLENLVYNGFRLEGKLLVNHSKKIFINLDEYKASINSEWIINPVSLLTAVGNGKGGGDFRTRNEDIGTWAWDEIEITDDYNEYYSFSYENGERKCTPKNEYTDVTSEYLFIE